MLFIYTAQCGSRFWSVYPQPTLLFIHVWPDHQTGWGKITGSPSSSIGFIWDKRASCPTIDRSGSVRGFEEFIFWEQYPMKLPPPPLALPFLALKRETRVTHERHASDWWRSVRGSGRVSTFPPFFARKFLSSEGRLRKTQWEALAKARWEETF